MNLMADGEAGSAPTLPVAEAAERKPTEYLVFRRVDEDKLGWVLRSDPVAAPNKDAAIKLFTDGLAEADRNGTWKAVSTTAWSGGQVIEVETKTITTRTPVDEDAPEEG